MVEKKKKGMIWGILIVVLGLTLGGLYGGMKYLTRTTEETLALEVPEDARSFASSFREYLVARTRAVNLFKYGIREKAEAEVLAELTEIKDGFSRVARTVDIGYEESVYKDLAEIMAYDATTYLRVVRELRAVMNSSFENEGDKQLKFMEVAGAHEEEVRSGYFLGRAAFNEDTEKLGEKGVLIFDGTVMVEVGDGVINLIVGDFEENVTAVSTDDFEKELKQLNGRQLFGWINSRLVKIGDNMRSELVKGWLKQIKVEMLEEGGTIVKTQSSLMGKNSWDLDLKGLVKKEERSEAQILTDTAGIIKGQKKAEE